MSEFTQIKKLKNKNIIDRVFKKGEQIQSGSLAIRYLKSNTNKKAIFISLAVSKKEVSLAVKRNSIKRKIRACIILLQEQIKTNLNCGYYTILYKKKGNMSTSSILDDFEELIRRFKN